MIKQFESFKRNDELRKEKGYTAKYKPGFIKVLFIDNDSIAVKQKNIKFARRYSTDMDFLDDFANEIGGKLVYGSRADEITKHKPSQIGNYIVFDVGKGNEEEAIRKAEEFDDIVLDTDKLDVKEMEISDILSDLEGELSDLVTEVSEISDSELDDKMDEFIGMLQAIKKINNS